MQNLTLAWRKARKGKTKKKDIIEFEKRLIENLLELHHELKNKTYRPVPLATFILRDPKTRVISKSDFRDRIVHHAVILTMGNLLEKHFIYDSCANQIGKGALFALSRFDKYYKKITRNFTRNVFCLKADIKHYFKEVDHEILIGIIKRNITDDDIIWLIQQILNNNGINQDNAQKGMPLGNYTSQFFGNVYLHELDYFVKHKLKAKYYVRYVDDFVILHHSREQLEKWKFGIDKFLKENLKIELHPEKSRIIPLSRGIDFVGFRNFYHYRLLRKRNIKKMLMKIQLFKDGLLPSEKLLESHQGWQAYAKWANSHKLRERISNEIQKNNLLVNMQH